GGSLEVAAATVYGDLVVTADGAGSNADLVVNLHANANSVAVSNDAWIGAINLDSLSVDASNGGDAQAYLDVTASLESADVQDDVWVVASNNWLPAGTPVPVMLAGNSINVSATGAGSMASADISFRASAIAGSVDASLNVNGSLHVDAVAASDIAVTASAGASADLFMNLHAQVTSADVSNDVYVSAGLIAQNGVLVSASGDASSAYMDLNVNANAYHESSTYGSVDVFAGISGDIQVTAQAGASAVMDFRVAAYESGDISNDVTVSADVWGDLSVNADGTGSFAVMSGDVTANEYWSGTWSGAGISGDLSVTSSNGGIAHMNLYVYGEDRAAYQGSVDVTAHAGGTSTLSLSLGSEWSNDFDGYVNIEADGGSFANVRVDMEPNEINAVYHSTFSADMSISATGSSISTFTLLGESADIYSQVDVVTDNTSTVNFNIEHLDDGDTLSFNLFDAASSSGGHFNFSLLGPNSFDNDTANSADVAWVRIDGFAENFGTTLASNLDTIKFDGTHAATGSNTTYAGEFTGPGDVSSFLSAAAALINDGGTNYEYVYGQVGNDTYIAADFDGTGVTYVVDLVDYQANLFDPTHMIV
ncbi:MAG: hypothetical protein PHX10_08365, partial [Gallionellaceae bacterium]|nr:hypothetical protein [Gallionellaceae bacterium]